VLREIPLRGSRLTTEEVAAELREEEAEMVVVG
jgi:hypothetical protein